MLMIFLAPKYDTIHRYDTGRKGLRLGWAGLGWAGRGGAETMEEKKNRGWGGGAVALVRRPFFIWSASQLGAFT